MAGFMKKYLLVGLVLFSNYVFALFQGLNDCVKSLRRFKSFKNEMAAITNDVILVEMVVSSLGLSLQEPRAVQNS